MPPAPVRKKGRRTLWMSLGAVVLVGAAVAGILAWQVDDWRRDLTTSSAVTDSNAADSGLRPLRVSSTISQASEAVLRAAARLPGWELADRQVSESQARLAFVCTTTWMRFKDDVVVTIERVTDGSHVEGAVIQVEGRARIGPGDLGRNPRHIKQLFAALNSELPPEGG